MNLNSLAKKEWHVEHFDGCPAFTEMTAVGFTKTPFYFPVSADSLNACYYRKRQGNWLTLTKEQKISGQGIIEQYLKEEKSIKNIYEKWLPNFPLMMEFFYKTFKDKIKNFSQEELWQWADRIYRIYRKKFSTPGSLLDNFAFYSDERLKTLVEKFCKEKNIANPLKVAYILSSPVEPSFINEESDALDGITDLLIKNRYSFKTSLRQFLTLEKNKIVSSRIKDHLFKYAWIKSSYLGYKEYSLKDFELEIIRLKKEKNRIKRRIIFSQNKKKKEELIKKYKFTPEIIAITKIAEIFGKWQDLRKIYSLTFATLQEKILKEISRRSKIDLDLLRYSQVADLKKILKGKFEKNQLKKRQESSLFIYQKGKISHVFTGRKAKDFFKKISAIKIGNIKEIKGITASAGKAKGIVKVVRSIDELKKVNVGNILVVSMTRPEHLMGMKKAIAIITDDGGITSHAAIISRELKKPCIIGTKIATKVLKDGDLVEVDANKGIVRIIKQ